ncbi:MAG: hypothetical protein FD134_117 [Gallionellaceae bacterium]|nr:MAG: hypothetical protein FD134_117 [Gallionellaceae bacterium]
MGFVVFVAMGAYLLISLGVVTWAVGHAKKRGKSVKKWGWGAAFVMYSVVLWDWIPTVAVHQYYCAKDSGFWVYKTLDQWKQENPGVMETLDRNPPEQFRIDPFTGDKKHYLLPDGANLIAYYDVRGDLMFVNFNKPDGYTGYWLNQRFNWTINQVPFFPLNHMMREEQQVLDSKTGEVLARYVDFSASHERRQAGWAGWKFWLQSDHCIGGGGNQDSLRSFRDNLTGEKK